MEHNSIYSVEINEHKDGILAEGLPTTSTDYTCQSFLRMIAHEGLMGDVANCINSTLENPPKTFDSTEEFLVANPDYEGEINTNLSEKEKAALKEYSGYRFAWINSVARGIWDYEKMGRKTPELEEEIKTTTREILGALKKAPVAEESFMTFRGTNLDSFRNLKVNSLNDLTRMKGQFMLEQGFTSTALNRNNSFVEHEANDLWIGDCNIEMRVRIPAGANGVIALTSSEVSHSPQQTEVLIENDSLFYISDVNYNEAGYAILDMVLIPSSVYDKNR